MTQRTEEFARLCLRHSPITHASRSLIVQSLSCVGGLGILSSGLVWAQTGTSPSTVTLPTADVRLPIAAPAKSVPENPQPTAASLSPVPVRLERKQPQLLPTSDTITPSIDRVGAVITLPQPVSRPVPAQPTRTLEKTATNPATDYDSAYIDPTKYSVGATSAYQAPSQVVLMERSTGCKTVLRPGQGLSGSLCGAAELPSEPASRAALGYRARGSAENSIASSMVQPPRWTGRNENVAATGLPPVPIGPISVSSNGFSATQQPATASDLMALKNIGDMSLPETVTLPPRSAMLGYQQFPPPNEQPDNADTGLQFPLSIPAPITSIFGWRISPVTGSNDFHPGTDLGAPLGTPVMAAYAGNVVVADYMGGYGLAVVLQHQKPIEQTLYGHLSQIFVQPGQWVQQGAIIGRVGSTGLSTGPHLHFEIRQMTPAGWVAIDPGVQLQHAMARLVDTLRTAQAPKQTAQVPKPMVKGG
ncbi:MAG: peptidoglycan DD-metalloendopeptidase family protein [Chroococcidiopsidaceae cyanobacterium CP_BM_ER_R8_30]|nr:peptidoglycan DD-metalloendopeptidase family protein [Chroococcidiopsidaceae cyanobacterium CP_BM_ER_R8_30]